MTTLEQFLFLLTNHQTLPNCVDQTVKDAHLSVTVTTIPPKVRGDVVNWTLIRILVLYACVYLCFIVIVYVIVHPCRSSIIVYLSCALRMVITGSSVYYREPCRILDCVAKLRAKINFTMPATEEDWINLDRTEIDVRRSHILADALKEGRKRRFDPTKLLKIITHNCSHNS